MTRSVYVIGGAGSGKSTFTAELVRQCGWEYGPLISLYRAENSRGSIIKLRGHPLFVRDTGEETGMYLGVMREEFPGTDGLDRVSGLPGEGWLSDESIRLPQHIVAEGATLATRRFLSALHNNTELLLIHLEVDEFIADLRFHARGSNQKWTFVQSTVTRSRNIAKDLAKMGALVVPGDTSTPEGYQKILTTARRWLGR